MMTSFLIWLRAAAIRAAKTVAQTAVATVGTSVILSEVDWLHALSVTAVAMIYTVVLNVYRIAADLDQANKQIVENSVESVEIHHFAPLHTTVPILYPLFK